MNRLFQFLRAHSNIHRPGNKPNVFIFSMPRSGSTWLQELIWTQPGFKYINEPLNLKGAWMQQQSGINGFEELYTLEAREKTVNYFKKFTEGNFHFLDPNPLRRYYRPITNRIVFKVIHGGEFFINDIARQCNGKVIYLLRHPIPVALSRKQLPRMDQLCSDLVLSRFTPEEREYALKMKASGTPKELRMLAWCLQNKLALQQRTDDWLVCTYEQLVTQPQTVIERMVKHADLPQEDRIYEQLNIPSAVSVQSTVDSVKLMKKQVNNRHELANSWRSKINESESERLMDVCLKMNFKIYNNEGLPNKEWLL